MREAVAAQAGPRTARPPCRRRAGAARRGRPRCWVGGDAVFAPVDDARRHIHAHLADPGLTLDIAPTAHVTPAHLVRATRAEHGTTPMAYLWERRAALAADLLTHTGLPLKAVAGAAASASPSLLASRPRRDQGSARRCGWSAGASARPPQPRGREVRRGDQ